LPVKTAFQHAALRGVVALAMMPAAALARDKSRLEVLYEVSLDIDNDRKADRAMAVQDADSAQADLYIYLAAGDAKPDLSRKPSFLKKAITEGSISGLESKGNGSLIVTACFGCGASKSWAETLTIVHRHGEFLVAGYARDWDWNSHTSDGSVDTIMGSCDIDFLSGKGVVSTMLDEAKPIAGKFSPVKLKDWSDDKRPSACNF
jgi:hypothetical protein